jgi:CHAD domain-containing protein
MYLVRLQAQRMPFDQKLGQRSFDKLKRHLSKLPESSAPESVHRFRTYSRRVEVLLGELEPKLSGNEKKLLRLLAKLRKKAGKVRDLDVQLELLRNLRSPQAAGHKAQLQSFLSAERVKREKKLQKAFDKDTVADLRKRLKRAERDVKIPEKIEPLATAQKLVNQVQSDGPMTEETLHQYRIAGKRARYLAELAGNSAEAQTLATQLKTMQDGIGDWHDWLQLTAHAENLFGGVQDSSLVAQLRNVTRAKYREAVRVLNTTKATIVSKPPDSERKMPSKVPKAASAA